MRRAIIFAIVLSISVLAPMPVPACTLFSSQNAECEAAQTPTQSDGMDMQMGVQDDVSHLSLCCQPSMTCCTVSQTLPSEAQYKSDKTVVSIARVSANAEASTLLISKESISVFQWKEISSPRIQSLFCTFLI